MHRPDFANGNLYRITLTPATGGKQRSFLGQWHEIAWDRKSGECHYVCRSLFFLITTPDIQYIIISCLKVTSTFAQKVSIGNLSKIAHLCDCNIGITIKINDAMW